MRSLDHGAAASSHAIRRASSMVDVRSHVVNNKRFLASALVLASCASPTSVRAHDRWANGDPVPDWVKRDCCSQSHAHHLTEAMLHDRSDGIHVDGYSHVIPYSKVLPSPDGSTWLFYAVHPDRSQGEPICFFRGAQGT